MSNSEASNATSASGGEDHTWAHGSPVRYWVAALESSSVRVWPYATLFSVWRCVERLATAVLWIDVSASEPNPDALAGARRRLAPGDVALSERLQRHLASRSDDRLDLPGEPGGFDILEAPSAPAAHSLPDPCHRYGLEDLAVAVALCRVARQPRARAALPEPIAKALGRENPDLQMPPECSSLQPWVSRDSVQPTDLCVILCGPHSILAPQPKVRLRQMAQLRAWVVGQSTKLGRPLTRTSAIALLSGCRLTRAPHSPPAPHRTDSLGTTPTRAAVAQALVQMFRGDRGVPSRIAKHLGPAELHPRTLLRMEDHEILALPNVGKLSLHGLQEWVHRRSVDLGHPLTLPDVRDLLDQDKEGGADEWPEWGAGYLLDPKGPQLHDLPVMLLQGLDPRIRNWMWGVGIERIGDLAPWSAARLAMQINLGKVSIEKLRQSVRQRQLDVAQLAENKVDTSGTELARQILPAPTLLGCLDHFLAGLDDSQRTVLTQRTLAPENPATYRSLENRLGLTRGRAKYLEVTALHRLCRGTILAELSDTILFQLRRLAMRPVTLHDLEGADSWLAGVSDRPALFARVLESIDSEHRVAMDAELGSAYVTLAVAVNRDSLDAELLLTHCRAQPAQHQERERESPSPSSWIHRALSQLGIAELESLLVAHVCEAGRARYGERRVRR